MEHRELLQRMDREHRGRMVQVCLVSLLIAAGAVLSGIFLFKDFPLTKGMLFAAPIAMVLLKVFPRPEKTVRAVPTRALIGLHADADKEQRRRLIDELCDRADGKDRMAKAFLYGRDWDSAEDGAGRMARRHAWESNGLRLPKIDRLLVLDDKGRFRTVFSTWDRKARKMILWQFPSLFFFVLLLDIGRSLESSNQLWADICRGVGMLGPAVTVAIPTLFWRYPGSQFENLPVNQVLFVFVHSRGRLRDEAGEWLRRRGSWDPVARTVAARLGLMEETMEPKPNRVGADHV